MLPTSITTTLSTAPERARRAVLYQLRSRLEMISVTVDARDPFQRRLSWIMSNYPAPVIQMLRMAYPSPIEDGEGSAPQAEVLAWLARTFHRDGWLDSWTSLEITALAFSLFPDMLAELDEELMDDPNTVVREAWEMARDEACEEIDENRHIRSEYLWYQNGCDIERGMEWADDGAVVWARIGQTRARVLARPVRGLGILEPQLELMSIDDPDGEIPDVVSSIIAGNRAHDGKIDAFSVYRSWFRERDPQLPVVHDRIGEMADKERGPGSAEIVKDTLKSVRAVLHAWLELYKTGIYHVRQVMDDDRAGHPQAPLGDLGLKDAFEAASERHVVDIELQRERERVKLDPEVVADQTIPVVVFSDGDRVVEIVGQDALLHEGRRMRHCIGGHSHPQMLISGRTRVLSYRTADDEPTATIELLTSTGHTRDVEGPHNGPIEEDEHQRRLAAVVVRMRMAHPGILAELERKNVEEGENEHVLPLYGIEDDKLIEGFVGRRLGSAKVVLDGIWDEVDEIDEEAFSPEAWERQVATPGSR